LVGWGALHWLVVDQWSLISTHLREVVAKDSVIDNRDHHIPTSVARAVAAIIAELATPGGTPEQQFWFVLVVALIVVLGVIDPNVILSALFPIVSFPLGKHQARYLLESVLHPELGVVSGEGLFLHRLPMDLEANGVKLVVEK
jgi:hypothetical protein